MMKKKKKTSFFFFKKIKSNQSERAFTPVNGAGTPFSTGSSDARDSTGLRARSRSLSSAALLASERSAALAAARSAADEVLAPAYSTEPGRCLLLLVVVVVVAYPPWKPLLKLLPPPLEWKLWSGPPELEATSACFRDCCCLLVVVVMRKKKNERKKCEGAPPRSSGFFFDGGSVNSSSFFLIFCLLIPSLFNQIPIASDDVNNVKLLKATRGKVHSDHPSADEI